MSVGLSTKDSSVRLTEMENTHLESVQHCFLGLSHGLCEKDEMNRPQVFTFLCIPIVSLMGPATSSPYYIDFPASKPKESLRILSFVS